MDLISLPQDMLENIISYLSYDEIAKIRLVSKNFNATCSRMLNRGFLLIERRHAQALKNVKSQLPRRESERKNHRLARHCDILNSIETRISMLTMTYSKYIDQNMCCFIPGKIIDEIIRVLELTEREARPARTHEVLQELRDISSMAIEHFDDKISPIFKKRLQDAASTSRPTASAVLGPYAMRQELSGLQRRSMLSSKLSVLMANQYKKMYKALLQQKTIVWRQHRIMKQMANRQKEQEATIGDLKKRIDECDVKCSEITHSNVGGKSLAGTSEVSTSQPLRHFSSQIKLDLSVLPIGTSKRNANLIRTNMKPRKPLIRLPSLSDGEPPAKVLKSELKRPSKMKMFSELQKIRAITDEIRQLNNIKRFDPCFKRSLHLVDACTQKHEMD